MHCKHWKNLWIYRHRRLQTTLLIVSLKLLHRLKTTEEKPNQRQKFFLNQSDVQRYFPDTYTPEQMQNVIFHLLRSWEHKRTSRQRPQREDELER